MDGFAEQHGFRPSPSERDSLANSVGDWLPFPDTVDALVALARRFRLGILSNVDDALFEGTRARLRVPLDPVVTAEQVGSYKPARANFEHLLARAGVPPDRLLHVAQSLHHDVAPAKELGWTCVHVDRRAGRPGGGATPPSSARADLTVPDLRTLAERVERGQRG